jgi:Fe-S cluster assembly ATP-binding protein
MVVEPATSADTSWTGSADTTRARSRRAKGARRTGRPLLEVRDLHVVAGEREILRGIDLTIDAGEVHALMGPNGSGKTTLAHTLAGLPGYQVTAGTVRYKGRDLLGMAIDERARAGLFVAYQYPVAIPGVRMEAFLRLAVEMRRGAEAAQRFDALVDECTRLLQIDRGILRRYVNEGFSGGEKKRAEILQLALLQPDLAVLDETDSGLDVDALQVVGEGVAAQRERRPAMGMLIITHYPRLLRYVQPQTVHVMAAGRLIRSGPPALAQEIEDRGYAWLLGETGLGEEVAEADREPVELFRR